jgi:signal transduction histidine kinase/CheY-like chemotaxis protein/HPt (histidine-containing phosphotransfer) domain-containing protein
MYHKMINTYKLLLIYYNLLLIYYKFSVFQLALFSFSWYNNKDISYNSLLLGLKGIYMSPEIKFFITVFTLIFIILILSIILIIKSVKEKKKLERLARIRTNHLNKKLQELETALESAKSVSKSKSIFNVNMSNELLTPLNSIMMFSEMAIDSDIPQRSKDYINNIRSNAERLLQIINDIMDVSNIESGKMSLKKIPFDLHELFASCRTLVMPKAVEKGILLHFYAEPSVGKKPVGDPVRLRQIFVNLLSNAVKFTNTGMVKLVSDIISIDDKSITIHFEIKDSGVGMTPEQITAIFDPFSQLETVITQKYEGMGLSLQITKSIIEMMGGSLFVDSTPGIGSKFSFDLTFDTIDVSMEEIYQNRISPKNVEKPIFEGEVLICEDNFMKQEVIREHLKKVGLKTVVAENGLIGVDLIRRRVQSGEKLFDLIFMDMHMPVMDGLEAAAEIVKLGVKIPIVALTANIMLDDIEKIYKVHGITDSVGKPFTAQELWRCLLKHLTPVKKSEFADDMRNEVNPESDIEFQESLEKYFVKINNNKYEEIDKFLTEGDIKMAHRLVHSLAGNAGQVGKHRLQSVAAAIEHQLADGTNTVTPEQMASLKSELDAVLAEFMPLLNKDN